MHMKRIKIIVALAYILIAGQAHAQQEPMYGQYVFNSSVLNPAQAGAGEMSQWGLLSRFQFVGIKGAPQTNTAYVNLVMPWNLGLAVGLYHDRLGVEENMQLQTDVASHARLSENWRLSAGIRLLLSNNKLNLPDLQNLEPGDVKFQDYVTSGIMFNAGAGLLVSSRRTFFGVSMPRVFQKEISVYDNRGYYEFFNQKVRHLFAYAGTNVTLANELTFMPSALFKYADDAPVQLDVNVVFDYHDVISFGPLVRSNITEYWIDAVGFLVGLRLGNNWYFGYKYEHPSNDLNLVTRQTHELSLRYLWGSPKEFRFRSPRYFL